MPHESPQSSLFRLATHALVYGGIAGALGGLWTWLQFPLGWYSGRSGMVTVLVMVGAIAYGIIRWRDRVRGGRMGFAEASGTGLAIGLVAAALIGGVARVHAAMDASLVDQILAAQTAAMQDAGRSAEDIASTTEMVRTSFTPATYGMTMFITMLLVSFISSLLAAVVVRKRPLR